jgi:hypothetical protein
MASSLNYHHTHMRIGIQMSGAPGGGVTSVTRAGQRDDRITKSVSIVILVDLFWLITFISTGIFHIFVLF